MVPFPAEAGHSSSLYPNSWALPCSCCRNSCPSSSATEASAPGHSRKGVGEEAQEKAQLSSDLGCRRNGNRLLWKSCAVMRWNHETRIPVLAQPRPWPCCLTPGLCPVCGITGCQCSVLQLLWDVGVTPFIHPPETPCKSTRLEMLKQEPDLSQHWDTFLCQLGKPAAPGLAQLSSSLLQTPLFALPGCCDYRGEIRTCSVCVTSQEQLPVSVSCLDSKPSQDTLSAAVPSSGLAERSVKVSRAVPTVGDQPPPLGQAPEWSPRPEPSQELSPGQHSHPTGMWG